MDKKKYFDFCIEDFGFYRFAVSSPRIFLGDIDENLDIHLEEIKKAEKKGVNLILFPQLSITGASLGSLFQQEILIKSACNAIYKIAEKTANFSVISVIGFPFLYKKKLYTSSAVIANGKILGIVPLKPSKFLSKIFYDFEEKSILVPFGEDNISFGKSLDFFLEFKNSSCIQHKSFSFSFEPSSADVILNPLAEPSKPLFSDLLRRKYKSLSSENCSAFLFANCGIGESVSDYVFAGECGIFENGEELEFFSSVKASFFSGGESFTFSDIDTNFLQIQKYGKNLLDDSMSVSKILIEKKSAPHKTDLKRRIAKNPFLPFCDDFHKEFIYKNFFSDLIFLQASALAKRLEFLNYTKCVVGISGGLDSSLALLAAAYSIKLLNSDFKNIYAVTMPCFGTSERTKKNALALANILNCTVLEISMEKAILQHFSDIGQDIRKEDITYENAQARERTQILMDKANQIGGLMIGSGDLSEAALGWMTYGGDHMSMYEVNSSIPKTLLKDCIKAFSDNKIFFNDEKQNRKLSEILSDIIDTPISPELLPSKNGNISQKTENIIGPYELHDFFIYHTIVNGFSPKKLCFLACKAFENSSYSKDEILKWMNVFYKRFFSQQFKRSSSPEGASVSGFSLSPRYEWIMPSEVSVKIWQKELESLMKIL